MYLAHTYTIIYTICSMYKICSILVGVFLCVSFQYAHSTVYTDGNGE